ncbi:MAG: hypothetical protein FJ288_15510 [Planctomycetes bacterium]|nr:hypothetical protein [Planctomycetota bacterium]
MRTFAMIALGLALVAACPAALAGEPAGGSPAGQQMPTGAATPTEPPPQATIANDAIKLTVYLPDAEKGFYRGARFDWSGMIARAEFGGHTAFAPFRPKGSPTGHDSAVGPAEEFDLESPPPGYAEAGEGGPFLKIGVGVLLRGKEPKYEFWRSYAPAETPEWKVARGKDFIEFRQDARSGARAYRYTKRVALAGGGPGFTIAHALRNTGTEPIDSLVYCHNFIILDDGPVGADYRIAFPFDFKVAKSRGPVEVKGREILLPQELKSSVWMALEGGTGRTEDHMATVENRRTGAAVRITGDQPVVEWRFYAEQTGACPEPFIRAAVGPGEEKTWANEYRFTAAGRK